MVTPTFWKWWQHGFGRVVASLELLLAIAFAPPVLSQIFGFGEGIAYQWLIAAVIWLIAIRIIWLMWVLFRLQTSGLGARQAIRSWAAGLPGVLASPWVAAWRRLRP